MSNIDKRTLREVAEKALPAMQRLLMMPNDELFDEALLNVDGDVDAANAFNLNFGPETALALLDALEAAENNLIDSECHVAELEESLRDKQALLEAAEERYEDMLRQARSFREAHDSAAEIIRKLERNKPTVTLPTTRLWAGKVACYEECEIREILRAAGIGVKGE
ncbi:ead/Ea22-like family protein [Salmonella enterica subsp. enterica serovar Newport]|nr:hypothetical protein [Salmonella enterica subsp. enterica serovar Newport]EAS7985171.1 hypothetical protein [Salmonella enterica]EAW8138660.1 hypothetical protein [Salmonella enterica]EBQ2829419.1 hypothetical protein [Salmonella enterica]EBS3695886.1 hypothetical protein [Salmonella enterica subsp. enterica serovar Newport]